MSWPTPISTKPIIVTHIDLAMTSPDPNTGDLRQPTTHFSHNPNTGPNHDPQPTSAIPTSSFKNRSQQKKKKKPTTTTVKRGESIWEREKEEREENRENEREERESWHQLSVKYYYYFYNTATVQFQVELYCSSIAKKFAIPTFSIPWCNMFWPLKCQIHVRYGISIPQC